RRGDTLWLDPNKLGSGAPLPGMCSGGSGTALNCYGAVTLDPYPSVNAIKVTRNTAFGLSGGTYRVYAKVKDDPSNASVLITSFTVDANTRAVWGHVIQDDFNKTPIRNLGPREKRTVSGKRVPIGFASGVWGCDIENQFGQDNCPFIVSMESAQNGGSIGQQVNITHSMDKDVPFANLRFYRDEVGGEEVNPNETFTIDHTGLLVLWVEGRYEAEDDITHTLNAGSGAPLIVKVYSPRIVYPILAEIFDKDGDGFGDSLRITFNRKFPNQDSLPNTLEVAWDPKLSPLSFGLGTSTPEANWDYWNKTHSNFATKVESDSILVIYATNSTFKFSENIKTYIEPGSTAEVVAYWEAFDISANIEDKIPAIVVEAIYDGFGSSSCTVNRPCPDMAMVTLSEPVKQAEGISDAQNRTPFAYMLKSQDKNVYEAYTREQDLPSIKWINNYTALLTYSRYNTANTPVAGDSVRFVWADLGYHALTDLAGNLPNPMEKGRHFEAGNITPIIETISPKLQASFSMQPLFGNYFLINIADFGKDMQNSKIDVYNLKGELVNSVAINSNQMRIKVPASGLYVFRLSGAEIVPHVITGVAR
ncbi:MAG: hypothetical protein FWH22_09215, partial [Fibromonadales bacterium]|nr:hypothetical protein [Fibromonadales bacterium]